MLMLISPAKSLDFKNPAPIHTYSDALFLDQSRALIELLKPYTHAELSSLMSISDDLAQLNLKRYHDWNPPFNLQNAKQAIFAFTGDVYEGIDSLHLNTQSIDYLQKNLRILSGLYGCLAPLDLIQAYRLEMGTALKNPAGNNLYKFWGSRIKEHLEDLIAQNAHTEMINLASEEYFKVTQAAKISTPIITPVFKDYKNGQYKIISFYAKRARGLMVKFAAEHQISQAIDLKKFNLEGYHYCADSSNETQWVFLRRID